MKKVLITGAAGLLGLAVERQIDNAKYKIYCTDNHFEEVHFHTNTKFCIDLTNPIATHHLLDDIKPDIIIHCAAMTNVDECETNHTLAFKVNTFVTALLTEYCKNNHARLIFISTDAIFYGNNGPYSEVDIPSPINYYGYTKSMAEVLIRHSLDDYLILRTSVLFGYELTQKFNFVDWVLKELKEKGQVTVINGQYSNPTFNGDLAHIIVKLMDSGYTGIINAAGRDWISRYQFAIYIAQIFGYSSDNVISIDSLKQVAPRPNKGGFILNRLIDDIHYMPMSCVEGLKIVKRKMDIVEATRMFDKK